MPSNKDRLKELANTSRRIARRMTTQTNADRFEAMAEQYDAEAEGASAIELPNARSSIRSRIACDDEGAPE